jgi:alcohol dehydrogenase
MRKYFEFFSPVKIVAGEKALEHIPFELGSLGCKRPMVVTDQGVHEAGLVRLLESVLSEAEVAVSALFDAVPPDSSTTVVTDVAKVYREARADALIAIGGGSVIDTAKGANILVSEGGNDLEAYSGSGVLTRRLKPLFVVPTTAGTGSEVTLVAVIKDLERGLKLPFSSAFLLPDAAILDPRMTLKLPPQLTAATAMDAMVHATESYISLAKNPLSDAYAVAAIRKISEHLVPTIKSPGDPRLRLELSLAATMAGIAFSNAMVGMVHALGHSVPAAGCTTGHAWASCCHTSCATIWRLVAKRSGSCCFRSKGPNATPRPPRINAPRRPSRRSRPSRTSSTSSPASHEASPKRRRFGERISSRSRNCRSMTDRSSTTRSKRASMTL